MFVMDTTAYLTRQGWLGSGHSLHPTGHGIKKPLLVSQKLNVLGIGKKKHDAHADQWWARAFDSSLKNLDVGRNETAGTTDSVRPGALGALEMYHAGGQKWAGNGGLYAGFVKGEGLSGTITPGTLTVEHLTSDAHEKLEHGKKLSRLRNKRKTDLKNQKSKEEIRRHQKEKIAGTRAVLPSTMNHGNTAAFTALANPDPGSHDEEGLGQSRGKDRLGLNSSWQGGHFPSSMAIQTNKRRRKKKQKMYLAVRQISQVGMESVQGAEA